MHINMHENDIFQDIALDVASNRIKGPDIEPA